jgi:hypothetical protein
MSSSSLSNFSLEGSFPVIIQKGVITQNTANAATVLVPNILATDDIVWNTLTQTAPADALAGTGVYTVVITAGTNFVATPADNTMRGTYEYFVLRSNAPVLNVASAP